MPGSLAWFSDFSPESLTGGVSHIALEYKVTTKMSKMCTKYGKTILVDTNQVSLDLISLVQVTESPAQRTTTMSATPKVPYIRNRLYRMGP